MEINDIKQFIESVWWTYSKHYSKTAEHEYIVYYYLDDDKKKTFRSFVLFIRENGKAEYFWGKKYIYYYLDGYKYWTMGSPIEQTIILNRAKV